jgi:hypothetical protein
MRLTGDRISIALVFGQGIFWNVNEHISSSTYWPFFLSTYRSYNHDLLYSAALTYIHFLIPSNNSWIRTRNLQQFPGLGNGRKTSQESEDHTIRQRRVTTPVAKVIRILPLPALPDHHRRADNTNPDHPPPQTRSRNIGVHVLVAYVLTLFSLLFTHLVRVYLDSFSQDQESHTILMVVD